MATSWRRALAERFMYGKVPRVFRFDDVLEIARSVNPLIRDAVVGRFLEEMEGLLFTRGPEDLIFNAHAFPPVTIGDTVPALFKRAVVSLHSVLGDRGVLDSYSPHMIAFCPWSERPSRSEIDILDGRIVVYPIDDKVLSNGELVDRIDRTYGYPRATAEAAIVHWFWLIKNAPINGPRIGDPTDLFFVDLDCVYAMAEPFGLVGEIREWAARAPED